MAKDAVFTMKLEPELRAEFMAAAAGENRPASQVMRELMREYIARRSQEHTHLDYLQQKVKAARASMRAARGRSNEEVERDFATRRQQAAEAQKIQVPSPAEVVAHYQQRPLPRSATKARRNADDIRRQRQAADHTRTRPTS